MVFKVAASLLALARASDLQGTCAAGQQCEQDETGMLQKTSVMKEVSTSGAPVPAPAPVPAGLGASSCATGAWEPCQESRCCADENFTCFSKNSGWAQCLDACAPGEIRQFGPLKWRTPWTCEVLEVPDWGMGPPPGPAPGSFVDQHGHLSVRDGRVVDQSGQPIRLTGMSLFWSQWTDGSKFWNEDVVRWLRDDWHCNVVRAAMGVESGGYLKDAEAEKRKLVAVVEGAIAHGIYVIVDWHEEDHDFDYVKLAKAFFADIAKRYGSYPNVLFETFNEPTHQSWSDEIKPYHEQVLAAIRQHSNNIVILGTGTWSQRVDEAAWDPVSGDNIAYSLHFYSASHGQDLRDRAQAALDKGVALFVTEWGTTRADGDGWVDVDSARSWLKFLEERGISCVGWSVNDKGEKSSALRPGASRSGGWGSSQLSHSGAFVRSALRGYWSPHK